MNIAYLAQAGLQLPAAPALAAIAVTIFLAIGIHEYAHAKFAEMAGDPTPSMYGRVTLNLTKHFDPVGTIMIILTSLVGVGIGWGKPVPMDPRKMKNPKWDHFVAVFAGPMSNLFQAVIFALLWKAAVAPMGGNDFAGSAGGDFGFVPALVAWGIAINLSLFLFNLLPLGPLDGMWLAGTFMSERARFNWTRWNLSTGQFVFLGLVILGQLVPQLSIIRAVLFPLQQAMLRLLLF